MVTEPSVDEELVPKNEDDNGNQEILMDQVFFQNADDVERVDHNHDDLEKEENEKMKEEKEEEKLMGKFYDYNRKQEILMDQVLGWLTHFFLGLKGTQNISSDTGSDQVDGEAYVTPKEALKRKEFYMLWVTRSPQNPFPIQLKRP